MLFMWIMLGLLLLILVYAINTYNALVAMRNNMHNAFAQIEVQLKRRHDLIPNLVEIAKGYMAHEKSTLEALVSARNNALQAVQNPAAQMGEAKALTALAETESQLSGSLGRFFALAEAYPDLKANQSLQQLSEELSSTENKVAFARQAFNDAVMSNNNEVQAFPAVLFASQLGFSSATPLQSIDAAAERAVPVVKL